VLELSRQEKVAAMKNPPRVRRPHSVAHSLAVLSTCMFTSLAISVTSSAAPEKEAAKINICLAPSAAEVPSGVDAVTAVRESFTSYLTGPSLTVTPLSARLESQVREEAKLSGCRYVLFTTLRYERKTTGLFGRIAAGAVQNGAAEIAAYSRTSGGRVIASATSAGAANMAVSSQIHQRDQLSLQYRLEDASAKALLDKSAKRVAKTDGEDVLTPMIQSAAEAIATALKP
jgi:hypothetical protein